MFFQNAKAIIRGGKEHPKINGTVYFKETKNGVLISAQINGLPTSKKKCSGRFFGFHIHERKFLYSETIKINLQILRDIIILKIACILFMQEIYHHY